MDDSYRRDDAWQRLIRNRFLVPAYQQWAFEGRYVFIEKSRCSTLLQKRQEVDTILQAREDLSVCLEEKIVRWPGRKYTAFALETESCTTKGRESKGWMHYAEADALLYAFVQEGECELDAYLILNFPKLKQWFWQVNNKYPHKYPQTTMKNTVNHSRCRVVDIADVVRVVKTERYIIREGGWIRKVPCLCTAQYDRAS